MEFRVAGAGAAGGAGEICGKVTVVLVFRSLVRNYRSAVALAAAAVAKYRTR